MGVSQHHDAVSGTEKQHVADDYAKRLHIGQVECETLIQDVAGTYVSSKSGAPPPKFQSCEYLNISICPATEEGNFDAVVYNPIGRSRPFIIRVPVNSPHLSVIDNLGQGIIAQIVKVSDATTHARAGVPTTAPYVLVFTDHLPALGFKTYFIRASANESIVKGTKVITLSRAKTIHQSSTEDISIENEAVQVVFDGSSKRVKSISNKITKISVNMDQGFYWYNSSDGHNVNSSQASGAYIFRPNGTRQFDVNVNGVVEEFSTVQGDLFMEATQVFSPWVYQSVRIYHGLPFVEFEFTVGPIPTKDHLGKEIISRFSTDLDTNKTWYTDANGREMQKRIHNYRPTWKLNNTEPVSQNYYPVNSRIYMRDATRNVQFTVLTDRSQGGASLNDGQLELMVHRRTLYDDKRGVKEPLNEPGVNGKGLIVRGRHIVVLDNIDNSTFYHRMLGELLMMKEFPLFVSDSGDPKDYMQKYTTNFTGLIRELPYNVHLLTLQSLGGGSYLLRLEHQFEIDETPYNEPVTLSLSDLFLFEITSAKELALGANTELPVDRMKWTTDVPFQISRPSYAEPLRGPKFMVILKPMEIKTFQVN